MNNIMTMYYQLFKIGMFVPMATDYTNVYMNLLSKNVTIIVTSASRDGGAKSMQTRLVLVIE